MRPTLQYAGIRTSKAFDGSLGALYMKAKRDPEAIVVPRLKAIAVRGSEPPASPQFQRAIAVLHEGRSVQALHVGPYDQEQPAIDRIHRYLGDHGLVVKGRHHEIYISDPRRTSPSTVIRFAMARRAAVR